MLVISFTTPVNWLISVILVITLTKSPESTTFNTISKSIYISVSFFEFSSTILVVSASLSILLSSVASCFNEIWLLAFLAMGMIKSFFGWCSFLFKFFLYLLTSAASLVYWKVEVCSAAEITLLSLFLFLLKDRVWGAGLVSRSC